MNFTNRPSPEYSIDFTRIETVFPSASTPSWHALVERWYQLDSAAFALCEIWSNELQGKVERRELTRPDLLILASPGGCSNTDIQFVQTGANSPAKFVHTLPNVRGSVLMQVMQWHGPLLCLQSDPHTLSGAISQAWNLRPFFSSIWIVGAHANAAFAVALSPSVTKARLTLTHDEETENSSAVTDDQILAWFALPNSKPINLNRNLILKMNSNISGGLQ